MLVWKTRCKHWLSREIFREPRARVAANIGDIALASGSVDVFDFERGVSSRGGVGP